MREGERDDGDDDDDERRYAREQQVAFKNESVNSRKEVNRGTEKREESRTHERQQLIPASFSSVGILARALSLSQISFASYFNFLNVQEQ